VTPGYSRAQIVLHWAVVVLVGLQFFTGGDMVELWRAISGTGPKLIPFADQVGEAWHMASGLTILFLSVMLLLLRGRRGTPGIETMSPALQALARWTHRAFYAVLIVLPLLGSAAAAGVAAAAATHVALTRLLLALIALHVLGALWHLVVRRDGVMRSILVPGRNRP
jgi:cytochrome b561